MTATAKPRILVVDDEPSVLMTYRLILEQQGYDVVASISSRDARAALEKLPMDLLLCDLSLEEKHTGFEVIEFARRQQPGLPCVLITGYASKDVSDQAQQGGVSVLFKPIDIEELLGTIAAEVKNSHGQGQKVG